MPLPFRLVKNSERVCVAPIVQGIDSGENRHAIFPKLTSGKLPFEERNRILILFCGQKHLGCLDGEFRGWRLFQQVAPEIECFIRPAEIVEDVPRNTVYLVTSR